MSAVKLFECDEGEGHIHEMPSIRENLEFYHNAIHGRRCRVERTGLVTARNACEKLPGNAAFTILPEKGWVPAPIIATTPQIPMSMTLRMPSQPS